MGKLWHILKAWLGLFKKEKIVMTQIRIGNWHLLHGSYEDVHAYSDGLCLHKKSFIHFLHFTCDPETWRNVAGERMVFYTREQNKALMEAGVLTQECFDECRRSAVSDCMDFIVEFSDARGAQDAWDKLGDSNVDRYLYINGGPTEKWD